eukprot:scaffold630_cov174-Amphora_coffeaeformis.AAC.5
MKKSTDHRTSRHRRLVENVWWLSPRGSRDPVVMQRRYVRCLSPIICVYIRKSMCFLAIFLAGGNFELSRGKLIQVTTEVGMAIV